MAATFVVEDGTGKTDANSYISVADADQYNENHQADTDWSGATQAEKEKALRLATQYLDAEYGNDWIGVRANEDQALDFPRADMIDRDGVDIDSDSVPQAIKDATVEAAILSNGGTDLIPNLDSPGTIKRIKNKVDVLEEEIEYVGGNSPITWFRLIERLIQEFTVSYNTMYRA